MSFVLAIGPAVNPSRVAGACANANNANNNNRPRPRVDDLAR
jgi:hypothetical protein